MKILLEFYQKVMFYAEEKLLSNIQPFQTK